MLDTDVIQKILPQRYPFLMIDRIVELETAKKVVAIKNVTVNEGFFSGHFPDQPVMPGVLIIEAMAQAAIMLFYDPAKPLAENKTFFLGSVKTRFLEPVFPGDQIKITVLAQKFISSGSIVEAVAQVGEKEVCRAELGFMIKHGPRFPSDKGNGEG